MKKIITLNIYRDHVTVTNNHVHALDENIVEVRGNFKYFFEDTLDGIHLELICVIGSILETTDAVIKSNGFTVMLPNSLFQTVGTIKCKMKLYKESEVLYIQEAFDIHVEDIVPNTEMKESFAFLVETMKKVVLDAVQQNKEEIEEKLIQTVEPTIFAKVEHITDTAVNRKKEEIGTVAYLKIKEIKEERTKHNFSLELDVDGNLYILTEEV